MSKPAAAADSRNARQLDCNFTQAPQDATADVVHNLTIKHERKKSLGNFRWRPTNPREAPPARTHDRPMLVTRVNLTTYPKLPPTTDIRQAADQPRSETQPDVARSACVSRNASSRTSKLTSTDSSNASRSSSRKYPTALALDATTKPKRAHVSRRRPRPSKCVADSGSFSVPFMILRSTAKLTQFQEFELATNKRGQSRHCEADDIVVGWSVNE